MWMPVTGYLIKVVGNIFDGGLFLGNECTVESTYQQEIKPLLSHCYEALKSLLATAIDVLILQIWSTSNILQTTWDIHFYK